MCLLTLTRARRGSLPSSFSLVCTPSIDSPGRKKLDDYLRAVGYEVQLGNLRFVASLQIPSVVSDSPCFTLPSFLLYLSLSLSCSVLRKKRIGITRSSLCDFESVKRIHLLYDRALRKFKGDLGLWRAYIEYCKGEKSASETFFLALLPPLSLSLRSLFLTSMSPLSPSLPSLSPRLLLRPINTRASVNVPVVVSLCVLASLLACQSCSGECLRRPSSSTPGSRVSGSSQLGTSSQLAETRLLQDR